MTNLDFQGLRLGILNNVSRISHNHDDQGKSHFHGGKVKSHDVTSNHDDVTPDDTLLMKVFSNLTSFVNRDDDCHVDYELMKIVSKNTHLLKLICK